MLYEQMYYFGGGSVWECSITYLLIDLLFVLKIETGMYTIFIMTRRSFILCAFAIPRGDRVTAVKHQVLVSDD